MKYLLTNGLKTSDINTYIKDVLYLNFKVLPNQIPFNTSIGVTKLLLDESVSELEDKSRDVVKDLLTRLSSRHNVTLILTELIVTTTDIKVTVNINNQDTGAYSINILN